MEIEIRPFLHSDAESLAFYANNKKIAAFLRDDFPNPYTIENAKTFLDLCLDETDFSRFSRAISLDGNAIGSISIVFNDPNDIYKKTAEIGYWLGEPYWGLGIMTRAIKFMCESAFKHTKLERIFAETFEINTASRRCLEKAGFTHEATLKNNICKYDIVQNSCIYAIQRSSFVPYQSW